MMRVGMGWDEHPMVSGRPLSLGGVAIESSQGLVGHSDADVVSHAIVDALLGACGLGTIGDHFPDSDPRWAGVSGVALLRHTAELVEQADCQVANVDAVVIAQEPRLAAYLGQMAATLADALGVASSQISVKVKSPEGLGHLGAGHALAAMAVALVQAG